MVKIPFVFTYRNKQYAGIMEKEQPVGVEVSRFRITDIDPADHKLPDPFLIAGNYDDDEYSFNVSDNENVDFLRAVANGVIAECDRQGLDRS